MTDPGRPLRIVTAWLNSLPAVHNAVGGRISWQLTGTYPAVRLADLGPANRTAAGNQRRIQVECWAKDYDTAEQLAAEIANQAPASRGAWPHGYCAGGEVLAGPWSSPDTDADKHRHMVDLGLWLYPTPTAP